MTSKSCDLNSYIVTVKSVIAILRKGLNCCVVNILNFSILATFGFQTCSIVLGKSLNRSNVMIKTFIFLSFLVSNVLLVWTGAENKVMFDAHMHA